MCVLGSRKCVSCHRMYFLGFWNILYFQTHQEGHSIECEYIKVSNQRQIGSCYCHV
jgi:hypothetical protein